MIKNWFFSSIKDEILRTFCLSFGKITDYLVIKTHGGGSRGFSFVIYEGWMKFMKKFSLKIFEYFRSIISWRFYVF